MGTLHLPGMPPLFDLILDCHGVLNTERVEAADADAAWRAGLTRHHGTLKGAGQQEGVDQPQGNPPASGS